MSRRHTTIMVVVALLLDAGWWVGRNGLDGQSLAVLATYVGGLSFSWVGFVAWAKMRGALVGIAATVWALFLGYGANGGISPPLALLLIAFVVLARTERKAASDAWAARSAAVEARRNATSEVSPTGDAA